jgi:hypothetical protein
MILLRNSNDSIFKRHVIKSNIFCPFEGDLKYGIFAPFQNVSFFLFLFFLMLDSHFISLQVVDNFVGHKNAIHLVIEKNHLISMKWLNLIVQS